MLSRRFFASMVIVGLCGCSSGGTTSTRSKGSPKCGTKTASKTSTKTDSKTSTSTKTSSKAKKTTAEEDEELSLTGGAKAGVKAQPRSGSTIDTDKMASFPLTSQVTYDDTIAPILEAKCVSCHTTDGTAEDSGNFSDYAGVKKKAKDMYAAMSEGRMPPSGTKATTKEISTFKAWLDAKMPESSSASGDGTESTSTSTKTSTSKSASSGTGDGSDAGSGSSDDCASDSGSEATGSDKTDKKKGTSTATKTNTQVEEDQAEEE